MDLPLAGVRVLDLTDGLGEPTARYLGDLGADVIRVEPPGGSASRSAAPLVAGVSIPFTVHNTNKRAVALDPSAADGQDLLNRLVERSDIVVDGGPRGLLAAADSSPAALRAVRPELVVVSVSDFGSTGPYREWQATDEVIAALTGILARSGSPGRPPQLPPASLATESTAVVAAWVALAAYFRRLRTGLGDQIDVSAYEATAGVIDPGYGIGGSATLGGGPGRLAGRPDGRHLYPIVRCADGWVRICVLSPRQWLGMRRWLGDPPELADPDLLSMAARHKAAAQLRVAYDKHFAPLTRADAVAQGQEHGVPTAPVLSLAEVAAADHFAARGAFVSLPLGDGGRPDAASPSNPIPDGAGPDGAGGEAGTRQTEGSDGAPERPVVRAANGLVEIDGVRAGIRRPAPRLGEDSAEVRAELAVGLPGPSAIPVPGSGSAVRPISRDARPLAGLRVLDLGVIVVGAELGRLLADMGADVIKIENRDFPDGSRQTVAGEPMTRAFAAGHRNKRSFGVNLRDPRGRDLFLRLAADADVILSNFKPGTLESLGLGYNEVAAVNPRIVMADSSAFGPSGPWSRRMGYGPLVRAACGLTDLWQDPDVESGYCDATTIFPDHLAARVEATAVVALLVRRLRTGRGGTVSAAQAETILAALASEIALESVRPGSISPRHRSAPVDAPRRVYPAAGDDQWVAVAVRDDRDFQALMSVIQRGDLARDPAVADSAGRLAHAGALDDAVAGWMAGQPPRVAVTALQAAGVPAGMMQRAPDLATDPHLTERRYFASMRHPLLDGDLVVERSSAVFASIPDPDDRPAPLAGQHTREIATSLLGLSDAEVDALLEAGVLEAQVGDA